MLNLEIKWSGSHDGNYYLDVYNQDDPTIRKCVATINRLQKGGYHINSILGFYLSPNYYKRLKDAKPAAERMVKEAFDHLIDELSVRFRV